MKTTEKKVSTGSKEKGTFEEWPIKVTEYEKGDFSISFRSGVPVLGDETVLSLINRQLATDIANESRRERTAGPAKRVDRESMVILLMSPPFNLSKEDAEAKVAEAQSAR